jgi:hypothetical protein
MSGSKRLTADLSFPGRLEIVAFEWDGRWHARITLVETVRGRRFPLRTQVASVTTESPEEADGVLQALAMSEGLITALRHNLRTLPVA